MARHRPMPFAINIHTELPSCPVIFYCKITYEFVRVLLTEYFFRYNNMKENVMRRISDGELIAKSISANPPQQERCHTSNILNQSLFSFYPSFYWRYPRYFFA